MESNRAVERIVKRIEREESVSAPITGIWIPASHYSFDLLEEAGHMMEQARKTGGRRYILAVESLPENPKEEMGIVWNLYRQSPVSYDMSRKLRKKLVDRFYEIAEGEGFSSPLRLTRSYEDMEKFALASLDAYLEERKHAITLHTEDISDSEPEDKNIRERT